jgi:hypothetical protein
MSDFPDFPMFAVIKDSYVIDCAFFADNVFKSPINKTEYTEGLDYEFVQLTLENSPMEIGMIYKKPKE